MTPGVLSAATAAEYVYPTPPADAKTTWRRRGFAEWLASPENPLTSRVMVNRLWQHHFGEGIVRTPSNFGKMGEAPSHPELLDWLAGQFVSKGWSIKTMHRMMMNSQLYQMASTDNMASLAIDPENRLFWRMPRERPGSRSPPRWHPRCRRHAQSRDRWPKHLSLYCSRYLPGQFPSHLARQTGRRSVHLAPQPSTSSPNAASATRCLRPTTNRISSIPATAATAPPSRRRPCCS